MFFFHTMAAMPRLVSASAIRRAVVEVVMAPEA